MERRTLARLSWLSFLLLLAGGTPARSQEPTVQPPHSESHDWSFELPSGTLDVHFQGTVGKGVELSLVEHPKTGGVRKKRFNPSAFLRDVEFFEHDHLLVGLLYGYSVDLLVVFREPGFDTLLKLPVSGPSRSPSGRYVVAAEFRPLHSKAELSQSVQIFDLSRGADLSEGTNREKVLSILMMGSPTQTRLPSGSLAPLEKAFAWEKTEDRFAFVERVGRTFVVRQVALNGGVMKETSARVPLREAVPVELKRSAETLQPRSVDADSMKFLKDGVEVTFLTPAQGGSLKQTVEIPKTSFE